MAYNKESPSDSRDGVPSDRVVWWTCNGLPKSMGAVDLLGHGLKTVEGCGNEWQESVVSRVNKWKSSGTIGKIRKRR